jgi:hypothetical protein
MAQADARVAAFEEPWTMSSSPQERQARRGTRIPCEIPIRLTGLDGDCPLSEPCLIILVNPLGCAVRFCRPLRIGTAVGLEGLPSRTNVTALVVNCISLGKFEKSWLLGLALTEPGNVWGVEAPPDDWVSS